jgi:hypothetical protein
MNDLIRSLRALAAATPDFDDAAMEQRLLAAFRQHRATPVGRVNTVRQWWTAAAVVLLACGGAAWWLIPVDESPLASAAHLVVVPLAPPASNFYPSESEVPPRITPASALVRAAVRMPVEDTIGRVSDFVPLPGAATLPAFERGEIVRIEVPLANLPAYGLDMVPDATPASVAADLLIGQDGVPRAIRLASDRSH